MEKTPVRSLLPEEYAYYPEGYIWRVLPAEKFVDLPEKITIDTTELTKKSEFHVTVINSRKVAQEIIGQNPKTVEDIEQQLQLLLKEYTTENPIGFDGFEDDLRLATVPGRTSIAARCRMKNVEGYFKQIKDLYNVETPLQPTHVSIYTETGVAVGINSNEQMESYKKLELPEVQQVLNRISV